MRRLRVLPMLVLAGVLSAPGLASAQFSTDHFKCYPVARGNPANEFVELRDQFDEQVNLAEQVLVETRSDRRQMSDAEKSLLFVSDFLSGRL